jgi:hypothetical protein
MGWTAGGRRKRESREQLLAPRLQPVVLLQRGMHVEHRDGYKQFSWKTNKTDSIYVVL